MAGTDAAYPTIGALDVDRAFYDAVAHDDRRVLTDEFVIPIRSGQAWRVPAGSVCRISTEEGPQVGDLNVWNLHNPRERLWASRTRQLQRSHVSVHDRLWSTLPYLRPLLTIIADTLADWTDPQGGRVHDLLGTRCDPYVNKLLTGEDFDYHCHSNLVRAVQPFGLTEADVHDVLNVFQCTGLNDQDQYFMKDCPARPGDHFEFFAELDLLCALSTCPGGDLSIPMWGPHAASPQEQLEHCHPLRVQVFRADERLLAGWQSPPLSSYAGQHGLPATEPAQPAQPAVLR